MIEKIIREYRKLDGEHHAWQLRQHQVCFSSPEPADKIVQEDPEPIEPKIMCLRVDIFEEIVHGPEGHNVWQRDGKWNYIFWPLNIVHIGDWQGSERGWDWIS